MNSKKKDDLYERLQMTRGYPAFLVAVPGGIGIYDDVLKAVNDNIGTDLKICTKGSISACMKSLESYHRYHFPDISIKDERDIKITKKNTIINIRK